MITVDIKGFEQILAALNPIRAAQMIDQGVQHAAQVIADRTKKLPPVSARTTGYGVEGIPVDTGRLRQSIEPRRIGLMAAGVFVPVNYSGFVHDGTRNVQPRPFFEWELKDFGGNDEIKRIMDGVLTQII